MITPLPIWVITNKYPAIYDSESKTAIEMVARLYGKMEEMIKDYNNYVEQINKAIADFEASINQDFNTFKQEVLRITSDYIACIDMKIQNQDAKIADAIQYMKDNIIQTASNLFTQALENGDITAGLDIDYDSTTETLTFSIAAVQDGSEVEY